MSTHVLCPNGHELLVAAARGDVACPRCGVVFGLGEPVSFAPELGTLEMAAKPARRPARDDDDDDDEDDRPRKRRARLKDDDDEDDDRPRKRRPQARDDEDDDDRPRKRLPARKDEDDADDDQPEEQKLTRKQKQLAMVRTGLMFHIVKLWIYLAALLAGFIFMPLALFMGVAAGPEMAVIIGIMYGLTVNLAITLAPLLGIVGSILCCFVPPKSECRGTIIVSLILDSMAPILGILQLIMIFVLAITQDDRVSRLLNLINIGRFSCTLVAWWVFMIFLRKFAFYMRETLIASEALNIITHLIIATVIGPALVVATFVVAVVVGGIFPLVMFVLLLGWLIYFVVTFPIRMFRMLFLVRRKIWEKYLKPDDDDDLLPAYGT